MVLFSTDLSRMGGVLRPGADGHHRALCSFGGARASSAETGPARMEHRLGNLDGRDNRWDGTVCVVADRVTGLLETGYQFSSRESRRTGTRRGRQVGR